MDDARLFMGRHRIDAWLLSDFRGNNPVFWQVVGSDGGTTRRALLLVPAQGEPLVFVQAIERHIFADAGIALRTYVGWEDLDSQLRAALAGCSTVAMEYSPQGALPIVSWVDGGTLEWVRSFGVEVVSAADLYQVALAVWDQAALASHLDAVAQVVAVKELAFDFIRRCLAAGEACDEAQVQRFIADEFSQRGLDMDHPPIVAVNGNSGNPHYAPPSTGSALIGRGDWVLIDLWARHPGRRHVFGDITWVGYAGRRVPQAHQQIFTLVAQARDAVLTQLEEGWRAGGPIRGFELDRIARRCIEAGGYGAHFVHRTGHSLGPGPSVHGLGANLDDLESRDLRQLLPGTGFTIEPGIYLDEFGVRLEINVYLDQERGPIVTTPIQRQVVLLV